MVSAPYFELAFNCAPIASCLFSASTNPTVLAVNDAFVAVVAREREQLVGGLLFQLFPVNPDDPAGTGVSAMQQSLATAIESGKPDTLPLQHYAIKLISDDSVERFEDRYWSATNIPIFGSDGDLLCILHQTSDVTEKYLVEKATHKSDARYHDLINSIDQGFCILEMLFDQEGRASNYRFEEINPMFESQTGLHDAVGKTIRELGIDIEAYWLDFYGKVATTGKPARHINHVKVFDRWFDVYAFKIDEPELNKVAVLFQDITEQRRAERERAQQVIELEAAERRHSFQLALADRIRPLTEPDDVTAAATELLGEHLHAERVFYAEIDESDVFLDIKRDWTSGSLPSMSGVRFTMSDFGPLIIDEVRAGRVLAVEDITTDKKSAPHAKAYIENNVRSFLSIPLLKDGRLRATLNVHHSHVHQWTDSEIALAHDMVDRTWFAVESARAQTRLQIEHDRNQSVFDGMTEGFVLFDRNWTVLQMNTEGLRISHRTHDQIIGKNNWDIWPETIGTEAEKMYRRVAATRLAEVVEYHQTFSNGNSAWIEVRVYPTGDHDFAVFFRDITERKKVEEKLRDADRRKDEFLAMLAHELRNPLAPISAAAQLLQMAKLDEARVRQTSQIIGRQVEHMTHLVNDLLDVSRVTRGLVELENLPLDIRQIVTDAVEQATPFIQSKRHHLAIHLSPDTTIVGGDKKRLVQVLANILNNAAKYTHEGGNILLKTSVNQSSVTIEIVDNGIGMEPNLVFHAFDLFAQAERSSDRAMGGLGLGLALVKSLVELQRGTVICESEGIGKGSKFTVSFPRIVVLDHEEGIQQNDGAPRTDKRPLRIMIVDDNIDAAAMLAMLLEAGGHEILVEHSAQLTLERSRAKVPDVFLLDIGLPEMDGYELARHLRYQPETAKSVLIAVTGYGQESDRNHAFKAGFDYHLLKPVDFNKLAAILDAIN